MKAICMTLGRAGILGVPFPLGGARCAAVQTGSTRGSCPSFCPCSLCSSLLPPLSAAVGTHASTLDAEPTPGPEKQTLRVQPGWEVVLREVSWRLEPPGLFTAVEQRLLIARSSHLPLTPRLPSAQSRLADTCWPAGPTGPAGSSDLLVLRIGSSWATPDTGSVNPASALPLTCSHALGSWLSQSLAP